MTPEDHFDEPVAARYDASEAEMFTPAALAPVVDLLAELAGEGAALELGIGTGRVALPLHARGVPVSGIDLSAAMVQRLRAKPGGAELPVVIGDFATARVPGAFRLAFLVFNTIKNLVTQDAQVACFANVARHLEPGGCFVIEDSIPDLRSLPPGQTAVPFSLSERHVGLDEYEPARQRLTSHHFTRDADGAWSRGSTPFRYVWPSELDLMAHMAGLTAQARYGDWDRRPFGDASTKHVSVWRKPPG